MNKRKITVTSIVTRALMALACATGASLATPVQAQSTVPSITINSCDGSNFPSITCIVTVIDRNGLPAQGLNASAFEVIDGGGVVGGVKADQNINTSVATSILFLIDLSSSLRGTGLQALKDSVDKSLDDMAKDTGRANDQVALIALNSDKVDVGTNPSAPSINPTYEVPYSIDTVLPRNTLRPLNVAGATPLYDGVRKALVMTSNQPMGRRAIIVMSDGFDSKSSAFTIDSDITMAQRDVTPMYTLKIGTSADNAKLQRLAIDSGGEVLVPGSAPDFSAAVKKIQDRLKTQYALTFKTGAAVGTKPDVSIRWKTTSGTVEQKATTITKLPSAPTVITDFKINGDPGDLNSTPLKGDVTIEPEFKGPAPTQVQYELDGQKEVKKQAPWS
ncbi:MAG TPA: VWA domain-containing protein, partial [Anaerolineae bacterium]